MPSEVELKFEVPPAMLRMLNGRLQRMAQAPVRHRKLVSVYFDTANRTLRDEHLSLRVRRAEGQCFQTVKGNGAYRRQEWEDEIAGREPDRDMARDTALAPFATRKTWRRLRPVFETDIGRTSFPVTCGKSRIEVALDHGKVKSGQDSQSINEIELELKDGDIADLTRLASRLVKQGPVTLGLRSKAERGYALADGAIGDPVSAATITLDETMTAADGFRAIALSCLHHLAANRDAVLKDDAEGVHQMRVGLRRLRAALSLFKPMIEGPELERIKTDLKWLGGELSPARDFDVFVKKTITPMTDDAPAGLEALKADLEKRRSDGFVKAKRLVKGDRYRRVVLKTGLWLAGGDWATSDDEMRRDLRQRKLADTAREILDTRTAKIAKKLKKLEELDVRGRHKLRIAVKKLRYAVGFFEGLFPRSGSRKRFAAQLKDLQDALGRLNDIRVHRDFAGTVVRGKAQLPHGAYALGVVTGMERNAVAPCLAAAAKAGKRLRKLPSFWT